MSGYSWLGEAAAERVAAEALTGIAADIAALPESAGLRAVILGGGYGRGEGGVGVDGGLYNDLDFFVICHDRAARQAARLNAALAPISRKWEQRLHIDVDFAAAVPLSRLRRDADTLMIRELLAGHEVIWGDDTVLATLPRRAFATVPATEGARLLLNRGVGLALAAERLSAAEGVLAAADADFVERNLQKAALGCGDALFIAGHAYQGRGADRQAAARTADWPEELKESYARAWAFKIAPGRDPATADWAERWRRTAALWERTLIAFAATVLQEAPAVSAVAAARSLCHRSVLAGPWQGRWRQLALQLLYWRRLPEKSWIFPHPRINLLYFLAVEIEKYRKLAYSNGNCIFKNDFLPLWHRFN